MPFSTANARVQRRLQLDNANKSAGGAIQALGVGVTNPNTSGIAPTAKTLGFADDSSLWIGNGASWANLSSGSGASTYADDTYVTFGSGTAATGGNVTVGVDSTGTRTYRTRGSATTSDSLGFSVATGAVTGVFSSGGYAWATGAAAAGTTGGFSFTVPAGGVATGTITHTVGTASTRLSAAGLRPPVALSGTAQTVGLIPQVFKFDMVGSQTQTVTPDFAGVVMLAWAIKTVGNGGAADTLNVSTVTGSIFGGAAPLNTVNNGSILYPPAFNTAVAARAFASGTAITVQTVEGTTSASCEVYIQVYRTA